MQLRFGRRSVLIGLVGSSLSLLTVAADAPHPGPVPRAAEQGCEDGATDVGSRLSLCGITTVEGSDPARVDVQLPATVTLDLARAFWGRYRDEPGPKDVTISGEGDFVGFALFEDVPERDGAGLIVGEMRDEFAFHAFPDNNYTWWDFSVPPGEGNVPRTVTLPPGDYDLYLLGGGSRVTVTLRLDGLDGATHIEPTRPVTLDTRLLHPRVSVPGTQTMTAGEMGRLRSRGVTFLAIIDEQVAHAASARGLCRYKGPPEPQEIAYGPTCPSTADNGEERLSPRVAVSVDPAGRPTSGQRVVDYQLAPAGDYGLGGWFSGAPTNARVALLAFWLSLEE